MTRKNTIAPQFLVLDLFQTNPKQTPEDIDKYVGKGPYASKYVCFLKALGHDILTIKDGRKVVQYVYAGYQAPSPGVTKNKAPKPAKVAKNKVEKVKGPRKRKELTEEQIRANNLALMRKILLKKKPKKVAKPAKSIYDDVVEKEFGTSGEIAKAFNVDRDWDSVEGLVIKELII